MSTNNYVNFWADVSNNLPSERTDNTLYFVTDAGEIYKGSQLVANLTDNNKYLPLAGGNMTGHIYLTGVQNSSAENSTQIIFGDETTQHLTLSSNDNCFVINPDKTSTQGQIAFYLGEEASQKTSKIPSKLQAAEFIGNLTGNASTADEADHASAADEADYATEAGKVSYNLKVGSKSYNGSEEVVIEAADLDLTTALKYRGAVDSLPTDTTQLKAGDVYTVNYKEYAWNGTDWVELGDEGSYALKTITIQGGIGLTGGGDLSSNRTIKANLKYATNHSANSRTLTNADSRQYAVGLDKSGYLSVNIPWTDTNTKMYLYRQTSGYNDDYPLLVSRTTASSIGTAGTNGDKAAVYGVFREDADGNPTLLANPAAGTITANTFKGNLEGKAASAIVANVYYGRCTSAADAALKEVEVDDSFDLAEGSTIIVKFENNNSANNPTLSINGTDAKPMVRYGTNTLGTLDYVGGWYAGAVQMFTYDGTSWVRDFWANTTYVNFKPSGPEASGGLVPSPPTTAGITKFLREDGRWVAPPDNDSIVDSAANHYLPETAADQTLNADAVSITSATWGITSLVTGVNISRDEKGHVTDLTVDSIRMPVNPDNDTRNTAGATDTDSKIFLVGATSQKASLQTYTHDTAYVNTDGALYSENAKVATQTWTDSAVSTAVNGAVHGTAGRVAKFNSANEVVNSIMTESNSVIDVAGNIQAEAVRIGGKVTLQYQNDSLDFIFS